MQETILTQLVNNVFSGELSTPEEPGTHEIVLTVEYRTNNQLTAIVPYELHVLSRLRVENKENHQPVERILLTIKRYQDNLKQYAVTNSYFSQNYYTDEFGEVDLALQSGRYKLTAQAPGFKTVQKDLIISSDYAEYPVIQLEHEGVIVGKVLYYTTALNDLMSTLTQGLRSFLSSKPVS